MVSAAFLCSLGLWIGAPSTTETATANGDTRTLHLFHTHTGETIDATFRVDGHYDAAVLRQLNHFLRDWRNDDEIAMDPRLFDTVWEAYRGAGATDRVQIYSAYRSPETNAMLRRRSRAVAEHSQHMLGKAMDTTMPGFPMDRVRDIGMKLQYGGVGWYPSANFVHLDVGGVRSWPRMPYDQLARLFPDGKTVHIPSTGQPMARYEEARAEIAARGGVDLPPSQESGGFFAWLFGGGGSTSSTASEDEEDRRAPVVAARPPAPVAARAIEAVPAAPPLAVQPAVVALAYAGGSEPTAQGPLVGAQAPVSPEAEAPQATPPSAAVLPLPPRRPTFLSAAPEIPLPPMRPDGFTRYATASLSSTSNAAERSREDAIANLIVSTASGVPMLRRSSLPAIITQGPKERRAALQRVSGTGVLPTSVLAFAAATTGRPDLRTSGFSALDRTTSKALPSGGIVALRGKIETPSVPASALPTREATATGGRVVGLRRAAKTLTDRASL